MHQNQNNIKNKVEALLFSSARRMTAEEISELTGIKDFEAIKKALNELKIDYESRGGSVALIEEGNHWKLNVKDHYLPIVQKIVSRTELDKPLMETLAVIAWKYPILQSEVIRIRHNKAYDHLRQLEEMEFVTRNKFGRTRKITLTEKFFEYFDLPSEEARAAFKKVVPQEVKDKVEKTEQEILEGEKKLEEIKKKKEEAKKIKEEQLQKDKEKRDENPQPNPHEPPIPSPSVNEIKQEIKEEEKEEDKEIEEIQKTEEELENEEKKEFYK
ncbi:SMC-Scp complex subunit ScpB [Candidatus Woesearchaeota archaeon]|nr:SMC-Scp complex subunit ScpB [Candidatus Woesearchaeota archaeon]